MVPKGETNSQNEDACPTPSVFNEKGAAKSLADQIAAQTEEQLRQQIQAITNDLE